MKKLIFIIILLLSVLICSSNFYSVHAQNESPELEPSNTQSLIDRDVFINFFNLIQGKGAQDPANGDCIQIQDVQIINAVNQRNFTCAVTVNSANAGSEWIACGVSIKGGYPENYCRSDDNFLGWDGNTAKIECHLPQDLDLSTATLVGHDFSPSCTPQTGKSIPIVVNPNQIVNLDSIKALISSYGLPAPDEKEALNMKRHLDSREQSRWATRELLSAERSVQSKGINVKRYLTTAWLWFETGTSLWPDPYMINCDDSRSLSEPSILCSSNNFQLAGYQAATRRNEYVSTFQTLYSASQLRSVLQNSLTNSDNAAVYKWKYNDSSQQKGLVSEFKNSISQATLGDISPSNNFFNNRSQFFTLLLGKDPKMVIALNSYAVSDSDLIRVIKNDTCGYGYICAPQKQTLSNMIAALYLFESGVNTIEPVNPPSSFEILPDDPSAPIVNRIVRSIGAQCPNGVVTNSNYGCLGRVSELTSLAKAMLVSSAIGYKYLQCVGFVKAMIVQTTGKLSLLSGDAKYQLRAQGGYVPAYNNAQNRQRVRVGDIPVWTSGTYGHIAYITKVIDSERGVVEVAEANISPGRVQIRQPISLANPNIGGWLTKQ